MKKTYLALWRVLVYTSGLRFACPTKHTPQLKLKAKSVAGRA